MFYCTRCLRSLFSCLVALLALSMIPGVTLPGYTQGTSDQDRPLYLPLIQQNSVGNANILDPTLAQPDSNASAPAAGDQSILIEPVTSAAAGPTLAINRSGNNLQLTWTTVAGSQGYEVHRSATPFFAPSAATLRQSLNGSATSFTDAGVVGNVTANHFYIVQAVNGNQKSRSNEVGEIEYALNNTGSKYSLIALPFSNSNLSNAAALAASIGNVGAVLKWNPNTQSFRFFVPPASGDNFALSTGDVVFVLINSGGPNLVTMTGTVNAVQFGLSAGRYHFLSVPLQKPTLTNASAAATDIGGVQALLAWNETTQSFRFFSPPSAGDNFALRGGMPFIVLTSAGGTTPTWPPTLPPPFASLTSSSPANGEEDVAVTRETILEFDLALDPASVNSTAISATFSNQILGTRLNLAPDGKRVTLFYNTDLPASARVRVGINGDQLRDNSGNPVDVDGDGNPGGRGTIVFDTLTLTTLPNTAVCGRVFASEVADGANTPLQGATITVDGMEDTLRTTTDNLGNFCLNPAPAGRFFVHIDGRTATNGVPAGSYYPFVGKAWDSIPGQQVNVGNIYLPLVPPGTLRNVSASQATMIGFAPAVVAQYPEFASVAITVPADSLYSDSGVRGGMVGIAPVPPDRLPGQLPPGLNFPIVITVQTDGATNFDRPVSACFPNLPDPISSQPLAAGSKSALWSFNHDTGQFEIVGPMTVSADGTLVCTDPGVGIEAPGWHGTQPGVQVTGEPKQPCIEMGESVKAGLAASKDAFDLSFNVLGIASEATTSALGSSVLDSPALSYFAGAGIAVGLAQCLNGEILYGCGGLATQIGSVLPTPLAPLFRLANLGLAISDAVNQWQSIADKMDSISNKPLCGFEQMSVMTADQSSQGPASTIVTRMIDKAQRQAPLLLRAKELSGIIHDYAGNAELEDPRLGYTDAQITEWRAALSEYATEYATIFEQIDQEGVYYLEALELTKQVDRVLQTSSAGTAFSVPGDYFVSYEVGDLTIRERLPNIGILNRPLPSDSLIRLQVYNATKGLYGIWVGVTGRAGSQINLGTLLMGIVDPNVKTRKS